MRRVKYAAGEKVSFTSNCIRVGRAGNLALPLSHQGLLSLKRVSQQVLYGRGEQTRRAWALDASQVSCPQMDLVMPALTELGVDVAALGMDVDVMLDKLVLCEKGGNFDFHRGRKEEHGGIFASMILQIPTESGHEGGGLEIRHANEQSVKFDFSGTKSSTEYFSTVFFGDCDIEMADVTNGSKLVLVFLARSTVDLRNLMPDWDLNMKLRRDLKNVLPQFYIAVRDELWRFHPRSNVSVPHPMAIENMRLLDVRKNWACFCRLVDNNSFDIRVFDIRTGQLHNLPRLQLTGDRYLVRQCWFKKQPVRLVADDDSKFQAMVIYNAGHYFDKENSSKFVVHRYDSQANKWDETSSASLRVNVPSDSQPPPWMCDPTTLFLCIRQPSAGCHFSVDPPSLDCIAYSMTKEMLAQLELPKLPDRWKQNRGYRERGVFIHTKELFTYQGRFMVAYTKLDVEMDAEWSAILCGYGIMELRMGEDGNGMEWKIVSQVFPDYLYGEGWCKKYWTCECGSNFRNRIYVREDVVVFVEESLDVKEDGAVKWHPVSFDLRRKSWKLLNYPSTGATPP